MQELTATEPLVPAADRCFYLDELRVHAERLWEQETEACGGEVQLDRVDPSSDLCR